MVRPVSADGKTFDDETAAISAGLDPTSSRRDRLFSYGVTIPATGLKQNLEK